jgi:hypothetical protein
MNRQSIANFFANKFTFWQILAILLLIVSLLTLVILFLNPQSAQAEELKKVSVSMKSELQADYSIDLIKGVVPHINLSLVREMMRDNNESEEEAGELFEAFMRSLNTSVPSVTPDPRMALLNTDTPEPTSWLTYTFTVSPTITLTTTETETATPTLTATATPWIITLTWTPWPTDSRVRPINTTTSPTDTAVPPTNTPVPPTNTAIPPTAVPPTDTAVPPTDTAVPPTETPDPPVEPSTPIPPTVGATQKPTATATLKPTEVPRVRPTKVPKDTREPRDTKEPKDKDKSYEPIILRVPMLSAPIVIEKD